jgi:hypothetical protein
MGRSHVIWVAIALLALGLTSLSTESLMRGPASVPAPDPTPVTAENGARSESEALARLRKRLSDPVPAGFGFTCLAAEPSESGLQCIGKFMDAADHGYPEEVAILVPFQFQLEDGAAGHYIVHLHGYTGMKPWDGTLAGNLKYFGFLSTLAKLGKNDEIMIVPSSRAKCSTYERYFASAGSFQDFMGSIVSMTHIPAVDITLTSHSGAFRAMQDIIVQGAQEGSYAARLSGLGLFDTTYWPASPDLKRWAETSPHRLWDAYRPDTASYSHALESELPAASQNSHFIAEPDSQDHWNLVRDHYIDALNFLN